MSWQGWLEAFILGMWLILLPLVFSCGLSGLFFFLLRTVRLNRASPLTLSLIVFLVCLQSQSQAREWGFRTSILETNKSNQIQLFYKLSRLLQFPGSLPDTQVLFDFPGFWECIKHWAENSPFICFSFLLDSKPLWRLGLHLWFTIVSPLLTIVSGIQWVVNKHLLEGSIHW